MSVVPGRIAIAAAVGLFLAASAPARAAFIVDFTDENLFSGVGGPQAAIIGGVTVTISAVTGQLRFNGTVADPGATECSVLACGSGGAGIGDSSGPNLESQISPDEVLYVSFSETVEITAIHLLDLFFGANGVESALVDFGDDGTDLELFAGVAYAPTANGYAAFVVPDPASFTNLIAFRVGSTNDGQGAPDFTLAALEFNLVTEEQSIPAPASVPLLLAGLAALGLGRALRRRRT